jgi:hypothetical protein
VTEYKKGDKVIFVDPNHRYGGWNFTVGKIYTVGGKFFQDFPDMLGIEADDSGNPNGHEFEFFVSAPADEQTFCSWWNSYYPQEYGHNAEFRNIVERHAEAAYLAGKKSNAVT